jgi:predicted RNA-binding protein with RPS1 domain
VHISNISDRHIGEVEDELRVGDMVYVKLTEIDDLDRLNLSREKALLENPEGAKREERKGHDADESYEYWKKASKS